MEWLSAIVVMGPEKFVGAKIKRGSLMRLFIKTPSVQNVEEQDSILHNQDQKVLGTVREKDKTARLIIRFIKRIETIISVGILTEMAISLKEEDTETEMAEKRVTIGKIVRNTMPLIEITIKSI